MLEANTRTLPSPFAPPGERQRRQDSHLTRPESEARHTGNEQSLSTDILDVLEEVVVVEVSHRLRIRGGL